MKTAIIGWLMFLAILGSSFGFNYRNEGRPASTNALAQLSACAKIAAREVNSRSEIITGRQLKGFEAACNSPSKSAQDQAVAL